MQQINLYLPELRPQIDYLSAGKCLLSLAALILLLIGLSATTLSKQSRMASEVILLEQNNERLQEELKKLKQSPDAVEKKQLERRIEMARAGIVNRQLLASVLEGETLGNTKGFSTQVKALSHFSPAGLSLKAFSLYRGGRQLSLQGQTSEADIIAAYLTKLRRQEVFAETHFGELKVTAGEDAFSFSLADTVVEKTASPVMSFKVN